MGTTPTHVYLVDGTYELFRAYFGAPEASHEGREVGATRGLLRSFGRLLLTSNVGHVAVAFDHVIESFRNDLFAGYKTGSGIEPTLFSQFPLAERASIALGMCTWPMVDFEADDAMATAAFVLNDDPKVSKVVLCTPDKDLAQCVRGTKVVRWDRKNDVWLDEAGVSEKYGVPPAAIPSWLALVGDSADGIPGIPAWGEKSAATVLRRYGTIAAIPEDHDVWDIKVRGAKRLAENLNQQRDDALLYQKLATLRTDVPIDASLAALAWRGPDAENLRALCAEIGERRFADTFLESYDRACGGGTSPR